MMKKLFALTCIALLTPGLAFAMGCNKSHQEAMSCAEGTAWDADSKTCKPLAGS